MTFNSIEELICYLKDQARQKANFKAKLGSSSESLIIIYKNELERIYQEAKEDIKAGKIVILNNTKDEESKVIILQKKQK